MAEIQLGVVEARYADIIWEHEPVSSSELVKLTEEAFHWKRTTAHNVLRRLCDKGLFRNDNGTVTSLIKDEFNNAATLLTEIVSSCGIRMFALLRHKHCLSSYATTGYFAIKR